MVATLHSSTSYSKSHAFGIVFLEPPLRSFWISEGLDVIGVTDAMSGVDTNPGRFHLNAS
jgi:hypothetical protein